MKFSVYNLIQETDWGIILYNSHLGRCVQIYKEEELNKFRELLGAEYLDINDSMVKTLYNIGYIVDDGINEYEEVKKEIEDFLKKTNRNFSLTLYVTENCNFRCVYCYEEHTNKRFSSENWNALYKYIEKSLRDNLYNSIEISFFGGEPLLELDSILSFLDKLNVLKQQYPNVKFKNIMTTNGYLLIPDTYKSLVVKGISEFTITLDGFADVHNQTRPLANGGGTWDKIVQNLKYINEQDDACTIKLNVNLSSVNINKMNDFTNWIKTTFNSNKIVLDIGMIQKLSDKVSDEYVLKETPENQTIIDKYVGEDYISPKDLAKYSIMCSYLKANSSYGISADGRIRRCGDAYGNNFIYLGYLSADGEFVFDSNMLNKWENENEIESCKVCIGYPLCCGRRCPDQKIKFPDTRPDCVYRTKIDSMPVIEKHIRQLLIKYFGELKQTK